MNSVHELSTRDIGRLNIEFLAAAVGRKANDLHDSPPVGNRTFKRSARLIKS
jgi:hypothetical protein